MEFTEEELDLLEGAVFLFICDVNHPKEREAKLYELYDKLLKKKRPSGV